VRPLTAAAADAAAAETGVSETVRCSMCGRGFAAARIERHQRVCRGGEEKCV
jgi:hypothetical protein